MLQPAIIALDGARIASLKTALLAGIVTLAELCRRAELRDGTCMVDLGDRDRLLRLLRAMKHACTGERESR